MEQFPMPAKNVGATLKQKWPDDTVKLNLKGALSEIERNILRDTKYIADNFDKLFDENKKLQNNLAGTEKRLRIELDSKLKAILDMLTVKLDFLDGRTIQSGIDLDENLKERVRQAHHLDDIQNQVGVLEFRLH
ncbi:hypothetical protein KC19_2G174000 [Ceratodon purpureus]|uniref:Uncharacterized protein n=1 Tax=Ceratodon purpureus TaxID=3225 RepID=A0A8T0IV09_CERPU|nr:hypothetical protein KC19_2G174000 [Ceratodon purpureus]